jgi:hypothetical protein
VPKRATGKSRKSPLFATVLVTVGPEYPFNPPVVIDPDLKIAIRSSLFSNSKIKATFHNETTTSNQNHMSKTIKCLLRSFLTQEGERILLPRIHEAVPVMNCLVTETYHLMNIHFRRKLTDNPDWVPPALDDTYVVMFMRLLHDCKDFALDADLLETKKLLYDPLRTQASLDTFVRPWPKGLNQIKNYAAQEIATCVLNNITVHFRSRVKKFLAFTNPDLNRKQIAVMLDNSWMSSHHPQHTWLYPPPDQLIGPADGPASLDYMLKADPRRFVPYMWRLLKFYEKYNSEHPDPVPLFSLLPIRKGFGLHHVRIDTQTIQSWAQGTEAHRKYREAKEVALKQARQEAAKTEGKRVRRDKSQTASERDLLWGPLIRKRALRLGRYHFGYSFTTDGTVVSVLCEKSLEKDPEAPRKKKTRKKKLCKVEEAPIIPNDGRKIVAIDPGKHSILYMTTDGSGPGPPPDHFERLEYTTRHRRQDMKVEQFHKHRQKLKDKHLRTGIDVQALETEISRFDSTAVFIEAFSNYLLARFRNQTELYAFYDDRVYCKMRFRAYQGKQKSEQKLIHDIEQTFGPRDTIALAIGNWSRTSQMTGCVPSPVIGMKNLLRKHFRVYEVDEFKTTKTCSKCGGEMKADPTRTYQRISRRTGKAFSCENRALRRCQNEYCGALFSRDYNAAINIRTQAIHVRDHGVAHPWFKRKPRNEDTQERNLETPNCMDV